MSALKLVAFLFLALAVVSLNLKSSHNEQLKTVTFKVTNTYSLPVADQYVWSDFPGLAGEFIVGQDKVFITYSIQTWSSSNSYFVARLLIDGVEDSRFRTISSGSIFHSHFATLPVELSEGTHSLKLQFRSVGAVKAVNYDDWEQAFVQITHV